MSVHACMTRPCVACEGGVSTATAIMWNGGVCTTCGARFLGSHTCSPADIMRRVAELLALLPGTPQGSCRPDLTRGCPCRTGNGGSGICGCIFGGPRVTC